MPTSDNIQQLSQEIITVCERSGHTIATAESCTGGLLGAHLTEIPGSSAVFLGGVIAYANEVKESLLKVDSLALRSHGAVSKQVAEAMAFGVRQAMEAKLGVATTGIAGPGGGSPEKPVGTVWIGWCIDAKVESSCFQFAGDRTEVRRRATWEALSGILERIRMGT